MVFPHCVPGGWPNSLPALRLSCATCYWLCSLRITMKTSAFLTAFLLVLCTILSPVNAQQKDAYRSWTLRHVEPSEVRRMLVDLLGDSAQDVRIIADDEQQELLLVGPAKTQQLADQLIRGVDLPASQPERPQEQSVLHSYTVSPAELDRRLQQLKTVVGQDGRISVDRRRSRIVVVARPSQHQQVRNLLKDQRVTPAADLSPLSARPVTETAELIPVSDASALFPEQGVRSSSGGQITVQHRLRGITTKQCLMALKRLLKNQLVVHDDGTAEYSSANSGRVRLEFDAEYQSCRLHGDRDMVEQFLTLFLWFERLQEQSTGESIRLVPLKNVRPAVLNRAIHLWRESTQTRDVLDGSQSSHEAKQLIQRVTFVQDVPAAADPAAADPAAADPAGADPAAEAGENTGADDGDLRPPLSGVSVQPFPGLDVLAIQGKDADVEELIRIIREIERLSDETAPEVEIYFLKNVHGTELDRFISTVLNALTEPLQGRVAMTPLAKPNALLLIGWGEAVEAAKKLIAELDQPVDPDNGMKIFPLKNAAVAEVLTPLNQSLQRSGGLAPRVTITPNARTNSLIVYASPRDMEEVARLIQHLDAATSQSTSKGRMVRLRNSLAADVATTITSAISAAAGGGSGRQVSELEMLLVQPDGREIVASGILNDVRLTPDVRTNTIFVTGPEDSLPLVISLIEHLDQSPAASAVIKVFEIANGNASDLVGVLRSLFPVTSVGSGVPPLATTEGETSLVPVRFSVDVRTNTIIATGTASDLQVMEALLIRLDEVDSQERVNQVYRLRNSPAIAVAEAVNDFLRSERIVNQAAPGRQNPFEQIQQEVVVVPEKVRNLLIISATPRFFEQILELVEGLDSEPPQVLIQVILAEVNLDNFHEFGVELGLQDSLLFDRSLLGELVQTTVSNSLSTPAGVVTTTQDTIVAATNTPGFDFNNNPLGNSGSLNSLSTAGKVAGQGLSHFSLGRTNTDLGYGGLVLSASSENVSVLLRALDRTGNMEILSRPQIMTLDNSEAFIQVGQSVPRIDSSSVTQFGQVNTVQDEQVGILLGVTPRINPGGNVVMQIDATKSEVGPEQEGIPVFVGADGEVVRSPRVNITSAQTTVSAASGQTIVLGGLITTTTMTEHRKVPWLGDLPAIGKLFRYDAYGNARTELLIILTPHVILGRGDAEYLKQVEMSRMSWVCSDVFEFLGPGPECYSVGDDSGVEVIYPDNIGASRHVSPSTGGQQTREIQPIPMDEERIPETDPEASGADDRFPIESLDDEFSPKLNPVSFQRDVSGETTDSEAVEKPPKPKKRRRLFGLNWGKSE